MTYARLGKLGTKPGNRNELVELLTRRSDRLTELGCLRYDVGISNDEPDTVFVAELWETEADHRASLDDAAVRAGIAEAMPLLSGQMSSESFTVIGSPLFTSPLFTSPVSSSPLSDEHGA
jgi:quinol monooxygenase YgiN